MFKSKPKNFDKIDWDGLSTNPNAIHILEKNPQRIDWIHISANPNAIPILEKYLDKIDWDLDRKSTRLNSSHEWISRMPSSA